VLAQALDQNTNTNKYSKEVKYMQIVELAQLGQLRQAIQILVFKGCINSTLPHIIEKMNKYSPQKMEWRLYKNQTDTPLNSPQATIAFKEPARVVISFKPQIPLLSYIRAYRQRRSVGSNHMEMARMSVPIIAEQFGMST